MSTKIFDAWRIKETKISALVELGNKVREFQAWKYQQEELMDTVKFMADVWPELHTLPKALKEYDPEFGRISWLGARVTEALLGLHQSNPVWVASQLDKDFVLWYIDNQLKRDGSIKKLKDVPEEIWKQFQSLVIFAFEQLNKPGAPQLCFVQGTRGWTYIKGFGLTKASRKYLDDHYECFEYTDATEMGAIFFSKEIQEKAAAMSKKAAYSYLLRQQYKRGEQWDRALGQHLSFADAGLYFSIAAGDRPIDRFFHAVLNEYDPDKKEKKEEMSV